MEKETYTLSGTGKVTTYNWMMKSARIALDAARATIEGQFFNSMNVLVYSAFTMEAFFNHLGAHLDEGWESKERKISKYKKFRNFNTLLGLNRDLKTEPYCVVFDVFDFRDSLAHGRTEEIEKQETVDLTEDEKRSYMIGSKWMDSCTLDNAEKVFSSIEAVITEFYKAAGLGDHPFLSYQSTVYGPA